MLQPSVVECTWSELRSLSNGRSCRPTHDGEGMGKGKGNESGQAVGEREEKGKGGGEGEGAGGVLELSGHRLLPVHRGMHTY